MVYDYEYFKKEAYGLTSIDLNSYKENQMKRRIEALMTKRKMDGFDNYVQALKTDRQLFEEFVNYITINVSEFYRNPEQWRQLDEVVIPELIGRYGRNLKIWSAACSTGDEPYSLVMALSKHIPLNNIRIYATDIDKQVIEKAKVGLYSEKSLASVPQDLKEKYFVQVGPSYKISDEIKARVQFKEHNLLKNDYLTDFHLIVCRNVLIYFTEETKEDIYRKFHKALATGGILFIGSTEQIINYKEIGYDRMKSFFYKKI